ncbi:MAG: phosphoribosyl-AMP cyclohydrolase [Candidatus Omnitrophota bacterium]|nr:phosphoribosyl-AMP cyclohydrolase [Candidatus Omnitrophota bacterium]
MIEETKVNLNDFKFDKNGLLPAVVQDYKTGEVLMLAYMNKESLRRTIKSGKTCFWSRSRKEYWVKGMTSGHFQFVKSIDYDCDMDAILIKVRQVGVACHTGNKSCFYRRLCSILR